VDGNENAVRKRYRTFAQYEAKGVSPLYEELARSVAEDKSSIEFLMSLPQAKQQPNLLLAAVRKHCGVAANGREFLSFLLANQDAVRTTMLAKSTQTNEPARCASLLPVLSQIVGPIAVLEVGAAAGLCLYPDRYGYSYGSHQILPRQNAGLAPCFTCEASDNTPMPKALPDVVWRAGIDLNPLSVASKDDTGWLEMLIWPEQKVRLDNFRRAVSVAQMEPPQLFKGDLIATLSEVAKSAPLNATLVVFHTAVLAYVAEQEKRDQFMETVTCLDATWISNEHPALFPQFKTGLSFSLPKDQFLLAVDGTPVATTGPHGQSIKWLSD